MNRIARVFYGMCKSLSLVSLVIGAADVRAANLVASSDEAAYVALEPYGVMEFGNTYAWRYPNTPPSGVVTGTSWKSLDAGGKHTLFVSSDSALFSWGEGNSGQLGISNPAGGRKYPERVGLTNDWKSVSAGGDLSSAIKTNGSLWAWGAGIPGDEAATQSSIPVQIGDNLEWKSVATGSRHRLAVRNDGSLWAWGYNSHGPVGDGTYINRTTPVRVGAENDWVSIACGFYSSFAIKQNGTMWVWGDVFGNGGTFNSIVPIQFGNDADWRSVHPSSSRNSAFAIKQNGSLWSWGENPFGVLGLGDTSARNSPVRVGTAVDWLSVAPGDKHVVATKTNGSIWMWGFSQNSVIPESSIPVNRTSQFDPSQRMHVYANSNTYTSGVGTLTFPPAILGEPTPTTFTVGNQGLLPLLISAINLPSGFTLDPAPFTVPPLGSVNYKIRLSATSQGQYSGTAHILTNLASLPDFSLNLSGWLVSPLDDTDSDGLNDAAEVSMASLGFLWNSTQTALVDTFLSKSKFAGLISEQDVFQIELKSEPPVLDVAAQTAHLRFELRNSNEFSPIPHVRENIQGSPNQGIKLNFAIPGNYDYIRLSGVSK